VGLVVNVVAVRVSSRTLGDRSRQSETVANAPRGCSLINTERRATYTVASNRFACAVYARMAPFRFDQVGACRRLEVILRAYVPALRPILRLDEQWHDSRQPRLERERCRALRLQHAGRGCPSCGVVNRSLDTHRAHDSTQTVQPCARRSKASSSCCAGEYGRESMPRSRERVFVAEYRHASLLSRLRAQPTATSRPARPCASASLHSAGGRCRRRCCLACASPCLSPHGSR
jgi:hypothetical protein